mgnify:CR=1 FL=1
MTFIEVSSAKEQWIIPQTWVVWMPSDEEQIYFWDDWEWVKYILSWCEAYPGTMISLIQTQEGIKWKCMNLLPNWKCGASWNGTDWEWSMKDCPLAQIIDMILNKREAA